MAGDWIKLRVDIHDDPSIIGIACDLGITENEAVGAIARLWIWANVQTKDGDARSVTNVWVDRHVGITGFAASMSRHGWLEITEHGIKIPKFERHNGEPAKARASNAKRNESYRCRKAEAAKRDGATITNSVTNVSPEKRREEKSKDNTPLPPKGGETVKKPREVKRPWSDDDIPLALRSEEFLSAWAEWMEYRRERRLSSSRRCLLAQVAFLAPMGVDVATQVIRQSIRNGWQGLFELRQEGASKRESLDDMANRIFKEDCR